VNRWTGCVYAPDYHPHVYPIYLHIQYCIVKGRPETPRKNRVQRNLTESKSSDEFFSSFGSERFPVNLDEEK
jgi:hypothetical protein